MDAPWFKDSSALVVGLARSGAAACRMLRRHGCRVVGSDSRDDADFGESLEGLRGEGVELVLGAQDDSLLEGIDLVVVSPGVPPELPLIQAADAKGITVISELEAAFLTASAPVVAVTGTNGKSTCVEMLGGIFRAAGTDTTVAGNVGTALSEVAESLPKSGVLVVEVSSFQLERTPAFRPRVAVLLNVTQDHLDRHGDMRGYLESKLRIFANQGDGDVAVVNADQPELASALKGLPAAGRMSFSLFGPVESGVYLEGEGVRYRWAEDEGDLFEAASLTVPGPHNVANAMAAAAGALAMGVPPRRVAKGLLGFSGLEHRMEKARLIDGVTYVNDSKATNPDSLKQALLSAPGDLYLIAGGRDKGMSFDELAPLVAEKAKGVFLIGEAAERLLEAWSEVGPVIVPSLEKAVERAWEAAVEGDWVLLSPGCASFDMFDDFEDRGRKFKQIVSALARRQGVG
jgi:UDP-N-acetylmuramoylalanine--D-glutamate ligase